MNEKVWLIAYQDDAELPPVTYAVAATKQAAREHVANELSHERGFDDSEARWSERLYDTTVVYWAGDIYTISPTYMIRSPEDRPPSKKGA